MSSPRSFDEKALIISEIKRLADENGRAPGMEAFAKATGIGKHRWYGIYWARWSDALTDAGLEPNELQKRYDSSSLLQLLADEVRRLERMPTQAEMKMRRLSGEDFPHPEIFGRHFGGQGGVASALIEFCRSDPDYNDVLEFIDEPEIVLDAKASQIGHVYLLRSGAHYKIGRTDTLERRIKEISVTLPETVVLEHSISTDDPAGIESYWHRRFADRRVNGEWFKLSREDVAAFRRRKFQ